MSDRALLVDLNSGAVEDLNGIPIDQERELEHAACGMATRSGGGGSPQKGNVQCSHFVRLN